MSGNQQNNSDGGDNTTILLTYMRRVAALIRQLESLKQSPTPKKLDAADLSVHLDYVEKVCATFEEAQSALEEKVTSELEGSERMNFVSLYLDVKTKLTQQFSISRRSGVMPHLSTMRQFSVDVGRHFVRHHLHYPKQDSLKSMY